VFFIPVKHPFRRFIVAFFLRERFIMALIMRKQELVEAKQLYEAAARFLVAGYTRSRLRACVASYQLRTTYTRIECVSCAELAGC
jgi:hypothetical protein